VVRIPSLSWKDFSWELSEYLKTSNTNLTFLILWYPIAASLGRLWDLVFSRVSTNSAARWSWGFTALPVVLILKLRHPRMTLFATGGATGSHLLALLINLVTKTSLYLEFQDPLMGAEMARSNLNSRLISKLEGLFISRSVRTVFVTKKAASSATERHPKLGHKIVSIYPGAWKFLELKNFPKPRRRKEIEILHLGTLYGARNLDNFFIALDNLRTADCKNANRVCVKNLGDIYLENRDDYLGRTDFELLPSQQRLEALRRAVDSDALLLVQHTDSRSNETIPYKTFDYLNLGKPIIGVINNPELTVILDANLHYLADASSVESIQQNLEKFLNEFDLKQETSFTIEHKFDIKNQFARIFK
jgi:hypothetical protein